MHIINDYKKTGFKARARAEKDFRFAQIDCPRLFHGRSNIKSEDFFKRGKKRKAQKTVQDFV